jgi:hypothetical protein
VVARIEIYRLTQRLMNPLISNCNSNSDIYLGHGGPIGCSAGCSDTTNEGGIHDADLAALIAAWPTLPVPIKAAIRALVATVVNSA